MRPCCNREIWHCGCGRACGRSLLPHTCTEFQNKAACMFGSLCSLLMQCVHAVLQDVLLAFLGSVGGYVETALIRASDGVHLTFTFGQQDADEYVCELACRLLPVW